MRIIRSGGAALALLALVVGLPIVLLTVAGSPLPQSLPSLSQVISALSHPDSGQLALAVIEIVGWVAWATFTVSVLIELRNHLTSKPRLVLPGLGWQQNAAAALIAALLIVPTAPAATAVSAPPATVSITATDTPTPTQEAPASQEAPSWVVAEGDSL